MSRMCLPMPLLRPRTQRMAMHLHLRGQGNFLWPNLSDQGRGAGGITQGQGRSAAAGYVAIAHTAARDGLFEDVAVDEGRGQGRRESARPSLPRRGQSTAGRPRDVLAGKGERDITTADKAAGWFTEDVVSTDGAASGVGGKVERGGRAAVNQRSGMR